MRGGVYRVVKEAMGGSLAKLSVSALLFDYILTGPISGVSAGQYIIGWLVDFFHLEPDSLPRRPNQNLLAAVHRRGDHALLLAANLKGIHESSDKALKIMVATTVMAVVMIVWCWPRWPCASREASQLPPPDLPKLSTRQGATRSRSRADARPARASRTTRSGSSGHTAGRRVAPVRRR